MHQSRVFGPLGLSFRQLRVLLTAPSAESAARALDVHHGTVRRWVRNRLGDNERERLLHAIEVRQRRVTLLLVRRSHAMDVVRVRRLWKILAEPPWLVRYLGEKKS